MSVALDDLLQALEQEKESLEAKMLHMGEAPESEHTSTLLQYDSVLLRISELRSSLR